MNSPARIRVSDYAKKPALRRAVANARDVLAEHGLPIGGVELAPGGTIRILVADSAPAGDEFARWEQAGKLG